MKLLKRLVLIFVSLLIGLNFWIVFSTKQNVHGSIDDLEYNEVGLVLGTSNRNQQGGENKFFKERMITAANLLKSGKVAKLIVSGDNRTKYYDEPKMMQTALEELGVPSDKILKDPGGFRTIESIKNAKNDFGLAKMTIITQEFHGYRALFISNYYEVDAQVISTARLPLKETSNVRMREFFARIKAFTDLYLFG